MYSPIKCATKTPPLDPTNFRRDFSGNHGWKPSNSKQRNRVPTCSDRKPLRKTLINLHAKKSNHHHPVIQVYQKNKCWKWGNCLLIVGLTTVDYIKFKPWTWKSIYPFNVDPGLKQPGFFWGAMYGYLWLIQVKPVSDAALNIFAQFTHVYPIFWVPGLPEVLSHEICSSFSVFQRGQKE